MKINAINFGAFTGKNVLVEESSGSSTDDFDDTRVAKKPEIEKKVSSPIKKQNGSIEDLMKMQDSTEKMAHSFGFSNVEQASNNTQHSASSNDNSMSVSGMSFNA